ncbi:MAG: Tat pathway signal protein [Kiritimatiellaeota bacterium]|nr:Tat pathway signal protein [Kiritimatiellota bacterium]
MTTSRQQPFWGNLLHLGFNMWTDRPAADESLPWTITRGDPAVLASYAYVGAADHLRCDRSLWDDLIDRMAAIGMNMAVIDLGEGVRYKSHPELAVKGSWTTAELRDALARIRSAGLEPIPKLNFSAGHDAWLGEYARMVSTSTYYRVCSELIEEVCDLFDKPRFFHLGLDEEVPGDQKEGLICICRQHELWWHDLEWFANEVRRRGVRPWIWSDMWWKKEEIFAARCPKDVLQSNWFYGDFADPEERFLRTFADIDRAGFDQVPTGSTWRVVNNIEMIARHARNTITPERLLGFLQTTWLPTLESLRHRHMEAIDEARKAMRVFAPQGN